MTLSDMGGGSMAHRNVGQERFDSVGTARPAWPAVVMFRALLLSVW